MLSRARLYFCLIGRRRPRACLNGPEEILATYTQDWTLLLVYSDITVFILWHSPYNKDQRSCKLGESNGLER
jgi:hypothetical protein